jgi:hypothetical protein
MCDVKNHLSLFVACLSVFILICLGSEENGSCQEKIQMAGSLVLDPLSQSRSQELEYLAKTWRNQSGYPAHTD